MIILPPFWGFDPTKDITQFFGTNKELYQSRFGIPAHNAVDCRPANAEKMGYGTPLIAQHEVKWIQWEEDFPAKTRGSGLWLRGETIPFELEGKRATYIETVLWHVADIVLENLTKDDSGGLNRELLPGTIVALMGNTGQVTPPQSKECPHCGTHVHNGIRFYDENWNLIDNEYGGYRDPIPFMHQEGWRYNMRFVRDLFFGCSGDDVSWLQTLLKIELGTRDYEPNGFFGKKTMRDVSALQVKNNITPAYGYVGAITRSFLNKKYTPFV